MDEQNKNIQGKNVYDYMTTIAERDLDIHDDETGICVTVAYMEEWSDANADGYTKFIKEIISKVETKEIISDYQIVAKWSDFIRKNKVALWKFAESHWGHMYSDEKMVGEWIREIHAYFAGEVPEEFYDVLLETAKQLKK